MSDNARRVLLARYLREDELGRRETPTELFARVARAVSGAELQHGGERAAQAWFERYFELLARLEFLPNSPTLMNAGTPLGQLAACFVLPVEDSLPEIFDSLALAAKVQQSGGGTGFSFSHLRARGNKVASTGGEASGPVSFMSIFDCATENIRQGGKRRGASMGVLRVDHPDIVEFVEAKLDGQSFRNFNLSVGVSDDFMHKVAADEPFALRDPRTGSVVRKVSAAELFGRIVHSAWKNGDPGLLFLDAVNRAHPLSALGEIEATNPCGEVPLLPYEACNLGSIHLGKLVRGAQSSATLDWDRLGEVVDVAVRFLDGVIDVSRYPDARIEAMVKKNRKVGLGVMGFAELLIRLDVPYASEAAVRIANELMAFISERAQAASERLAVQRGAFPSWRDSAHAARGRRLRNATLTSIAPTGTIGIMADTTASIEPLFGLAYRRENVLGKTTLVEINPLFAAAARRHGIDPAALEKSVIASGTLAGATKLPKPLVELFRTALEIPPEQHLRVQQAFQRWVDNAVSKTVNLPADAAEEDVARVYRRAFELGLKGITVYRYGSRSEQVLILGNEQTAETREHFARCDPHACEI